MPVESRPLRRDAQRNRELLLAAAREVFGAKGLEAPLDEIARRAGVAIGTLYNRFPTRAELIDATFAEPVGRWVTIGEEALAEPDPWDGIVQYVVRSCELHSIDRGLTQVCTESYPDAPGIEAAKLRSWDVLVRLVARAKDAGVLRADAEPSDLPMAVVAASRIAELESDPDRWRRHIRYVLDGLRADKRRATRR
ncbi:TetR/AcrR family transcriptional regulator [Amycolatopsis sp. GM8]|uniref:TetR/AcrR family transcriptional regulator n=1 Tax=Amycolatopsis sp. GM8 TaxID=2896530 RepID=UPI001F43A245|nr:TetR/AcrR family transcriptional regulator [Amycolatopsis sp. GM8]